MNNQKSNAFGYAVADSVNSKYAHLIYFKNKDAALPGWSKKVNMAERSEPISNFINYILRLVKANYLPGGVRDVDFIDFFLNETKEPIVRLTAQYAQWDPKYAVDENWKRARTVIDTMYTLIESGYKVEEIQNKLHIRSKPKVVFDPHDMSPKWSTEKALRLYCDDIVKRGYAQGAVEMYYRNYCNKYFPKN